MGKIQYRVSACMLSLRFSVPAFLKNGAFAQESVRHWLPQTIQCVDTPNGQADDKEALIWS